MKSTTGSFVVYSSKGRESSYLCRDGCCEFVLREEK